MKWDAHEKFKGLHNLEVGELVELIRVLSVAGMGMDWGREIIRNPDLARNMLDAHLNPERLAARPTFVNKYFVPPEVQIENVSRWSQDFGWDIRPQDFEAIVEHPVWPEGELTALILVPYIYSGITHGEKDSLATSTFRGLMDAIEITQSTIQMNDSEFERGNFFFDWHPSEQIRLRWESISFNKSTGVRPARRREFSGQLPHAGVLAAIAHHPEWVRCMNGTSVPYVWVGGLTLEPHEKQVRREVRMRWDYPGVRFNLFDFPEGQGLEDRFDTTAVPEFI